MKAPATRHTMKMHNLSPLPLAGIRSVLIGSAAVLIGICFPRTAKADPPPTLPPALVLPPGLFCFRITDIVAVPADPGANRFQFEFEILNWTNQDVNDLHLMRNTGGSGLNPFLPPAIGGTPIFSGAIIDPNGRPIGVGNDDANFAAFGNVGAKVGQANGWAVTLATPTRVDYTNLGGGPLLPRRDLLGAGNTVAAAALIPGAVVNAGVPSLPFGSETVDNGAPGVFGPGANGVDNVLDGFVLDVDDFDAGESLSMNWFFTNAAGQPVGVSGAGNQFGWGVFNIFRVASSGPAMWARFPGNPEGPGSNTGTSTTDVWDGVSTTPTGESFEFEMGAAVTGNFVNPADNLFNANVNASQVPEPTTMLLVSFGLIGLALRRRR